MHQLFVTIAGILTFLEMHPGWMPSTVGTLLGQNKKCLVSGNPTNPPVLPATQNFM